MAKKLKVGDVVHGYRVTNVFGPGMMAISYGAQGPEGRKVFLKQYKSPAPTVVWYMPFVAYQKELSARVRHGSAVHFAVNQVDAFEEIWGGRCYFQVYEFVENGADLQHILDDEREHHERTKSPATVDPSIWARHVTWAKVFMSGVAALHESRIVHADLKPANVYLIRDPTIGAGYQLKLIDMDFSLLADQRAPWHGFQAYIGTDNYRSPEHLTRGAVPDLPSDVFTCGLILYELLAGYHPYWQEDQAEYTRLVRAHDAKPPALSGMMPSPASNAEVSAVLYRCLSPDPAGRPTAAELRAILSGRNRKTATIAPATRGAVPGVTGIHGAPARRTAAAGGRPITSNGLELLTPDGSSLRIAIRTELGKALVRQFGSDADFWDDRQCTFERSTTGQWVVTPIPGTTNETIVNGEALTGPRPLQQGDSIGVGRQARGIIKLPLMVRGL
jgi:eukaryotic-like serine/threonine-protein kinase